MTTATAPAPQSRTRKCCARRAPNGSPRCAAMCSKRCWGAIVRSVPTRSSSASPAMARRRRSRSIALFPARKRPRSPHRKPQRLRRMCAQPCRRRRLHRVPHLRALWCRRRSARRQRRGDAEGLVTGRGFCAEKPGDRDCGHLRPLPRALRACFPSLPRSLSRRTAAASLARRN